MINEDDFVPTVPMTGWQFVRYGKSAVIDMTSNMEDQWHDLTGINWYNQMSKKNLDKLAGSLDDASPGSASKKWANCYTYTCDCHGDGSYDDMTEMMKLSAFSGVSVRARIYAKLNENAEPDLFNRYPVCQLPAYFMQAPGDIMVSGLGDKVVKVLNTYQFVSRYQGARNQVVLAAAAGGISCPHYCLTYYLLNNYATEAKFK